MKGVSKAGVNRGVHQADAAVEAVGQSDLNDIGDDKPALPEERLECQPTQEELQLQGQGLQSKRQEPVTTRTAKPPSANTHSRFRRSNVSVKQPKNIAAGPNIAAEQQNQGENVTCRPAAGQNENPNPAPVESQAETHKVKKDQTADSEHDPHAEGVRLGHYVFGKSLGKGTFGKVKLAEHILTKEKVAIKILEKARIKDRKDIARISREIKILKKVRHPNVIQLYEIIETETELYLIMEYCVNGELFDYIVQQQRLHEKAAVRIYQQLVAGIEYIHKSGICHRDLKPENLLLDFDKTLKIVDFGLSNVYEPPDGLLKTACGSPCYAAPEMIAGKRYRGVKSDIWSSGVVLYAMVCGFLPFEDPKTSNLYKKIMAGEFKLPRFLSTDCSHFLSKILQTNPDERYGIVQIREHPWYRQFRDKQPQGLFPGQELMPVEDSIYEQILDEFGFDPDYSVKCIEANRHNNVTATYHLLYKRVLRQQKPFTNVSLQTGSLDRTAVARYERIEAMNKGANQAADERASRFNKECQQTETYQNQQRRGVSTNYHDYKNQNALQSVNGGPETAELNPNQVQIISAQQRYKLELQAEMNKLRGKTKKNTSWKPPKEIQNNEKAAGEVTSSAQVSVKNQQNVASTDATPTEPRLSIVQESTKRTERQQPRITSKPPVKSQEKNSPETLRKRTLQNRVNLVQIQNQQCSNQSKEELKDEQPANQILPQKLQKKQQTKQYSSQPEGHDANKLTEEGEFVFAESEVHEKRQDEPENNVQQNQLFDKSAHKVSTLSSLGAATKSGSDKNRKKFPSATTTKGSQVLRRHMQLKQNSQKKATEDATQELLNSSMPINLPAHRGLLNEPFNHIESKSGGRKTSQNVAQISQNVQQIVTQNTQSRYRHQKTASLNGGSALNVSQFNTIGDTQDLSLNIRSKKEKQYMSLNGTQSLMNNSLDLTQPTGAGAGQVSTYSTIAAGQSLKNVKQISMNHRQIEHLTGNLNRSSQQKRQSLKNSDGPTQATNVVKYNLNRASIGGIIGQQKQMQAQRAKQSNNSRQQPKISKPSLMPNINENFDNMPIMNQRQIGPTAQHFAIKHRQSFKQTANLNNQLMGLQSGGSPVNDATSILARRAGSLQWRNTSTLSNRDGRDSVNSNHSQQQQQNLINTMLQNTMFPNRQSNPSQVQNSQLNVAQPATQANCLGDYDFAPIDPITQTGSLPFKKHSHHPARIITNSESGQLGSSKPLQLTQINPQSLGQTSELHINLFAQNPIDFHKVNLIPQTNTKANLLQQPSNKAQQLKNRKGINQSIDYKPSQTQHLKTTLKGQGQLPSSQATRKNTQNRQYTLESEASQNNYASSVSGWVNQNILPSQQKSELLEKSAKSVMNRNRNLKADIACLEQQNLTSSSAAQNINQLYQQYAGNTMKATRVIKAKATGNLVPRQAAQTVLEKHSTGGLALDSILTQTLRGVEQPSQNTGTKNQQFMNLMHSGLPQSRPKLEPHQDRSLTKPAKASANTSSSRQKQASSIDSATRTQIKTSAKLNQSVRKSRIEIPANLVNKDNSNKRSTPVQHPKRKANDMEACMDRQNFLMSEAPSNRATSDVKAALSRFDSSKPSKIQTKDSKEGVSSATRYVAL